jgi:hypothetical protein
VPWGRDWKAALPLELQAQIDDLRTGRMRAPDMAGTRATPAPPAATTVEGSGDAGGGAAAQGATGGSPQAILDLFQAAEENLAASRCEDYYQRQMSPNFRRTLAPRALRTLVGSCQSRAETREPLLAALRIARETAPRFEYAGTRAIYDLRGKGLPFTQLVVEQVDKRWYIAE